MGQAAAWAGRHVVCGQVSQLGVLLAGLGQTDSTKRENGPPSEGGLSLTVALVWVTESTFTDTDQLQGGEQCMGDMVCRG